MKNIAFAKEYQCPKCGISFKFNEAINLVSNKSPKWNDLSDKYENSCPNCKLRVIVNNKLYSFLLVVMGVVVSFIISEIMNGYTGFTKEIIVMLSLLPFFLAATNILRLEFCENL